jgi:hypothetical protein
MYSVLFKKKVDCLNFDICRRTEDLTTSSIAVSQAIHNIQGDSSFTAGGKMTLKG